MTAGEIWTQAASLFLTINRASFSASALLFMAVITAMYFRFIRRMPREPLPVPGGTKTFGVGYWGLLNSSTGWNLTITRRLGIVLLVAGLMSSYFFRSVT